MADGRVVNLEEIVEDVLPEGLDLALDGKRNENVETLSRRLRHLSLWGRRCPGWWRG
jgi:hypothetical protein